MKRIMLSLTIAASLGALAGCGSRSDNEELGAQLAIKAPPTGPSRAKLDISCGKDTYTISTGSNSGTCYAHAGGGTCKDGANTSNVKCGHGCTTTTGSGSCTGK